MIAPPHCNLALMNHPQKGIEIVSVKNKTKYLLYLP